MRGECGARRGGNGIVLCGPGRGLGAAELTRREAFVVALEDASDMENTAQNLFAGGDVDFALCPPAPATHSGRTRDPRATTHCTHIHASFFLKSYGYKLYVS